MPYKEMNWKEQNFILKRFKVKVYKILENQNWIQEPQKWQLLLTDGFNIVWNNKESNSLKKEGESIWVVTGWKKAVIHSEPTNPFDLKSFEETQYEPRIYVDHNQTNDVNYENIQS